MKQILVVEDGAPIRDLVKYILIDEQYQVVACADIREFWEKFSFSSPDLILLDIRLPDGNGIELCRKLYEQGGNIPIVLMSAHGIRKEIEAEPCMQAFIEKPFDIDELLTVIQEHVA